MVNDQSSTDNIFIDIVLITENRLELLLSTLRSLEKAAVGRDVRLLVGFNGSTDQYVVEATHLIYSIQFKRGHLISRFEKKWPGSARNSLIEASKAQWIFFCDDDVLVPSEIFENFDNLQQRFPQVKAFGGPNLTPPGSSDVERAQGHALSLRMVTGPMSHRYRQTNHAQTRWVHNALSLTLCNLFWKKSLKTYFPEQFICGEELHLLKSTPGPYICSTLLSVFHYRRNHWSSFFQQTIKYGIGRSQQSPAVILLAWILLPALAAVALYFPLGTVMAIIIFLIALGFEVLNSLNLKKEDSNLISKVILAAITIWTGYGLGILFGFLKNRQVEKSMVYEAT